MNREAETLRQATIHEVSEPGSPEGGSGSDKSPGTSVLSNMLRRSPPSTSPPQEEVVENSAEDNNDNEIESSSTQKRLIITPNGVQEDERTPLLGKDSIQHRQQPDWIRGERDLERQEQKRRVSWPKLRNVVLWPKERGLDIARNVLNPKSWDRKVVWENAVVAPVKCLPAVVIGLLLTILDALSYGMYTSSRTGNDFPLPRSQNLSPGFPLAILVSYN